MPLSIPDDHAHLTGRVVESTVVVEVTVQHLDDDKPEPHEVANAIRDGLHSTFFAGRWPVIAWTIERLQGGTHE